jgi:RNA polymerase-binding transcription factor DksA
MIDIKKYKSKLEEEKKLVEKEMDEVGRQNPSEPGDWEPVETDMGSDPADENNVADEMESFGENSAVLDKLEIEYKDINEALEKIENDTYGKCEVGGENIPEDRLEAYPAAKTCVEHSKGKK